MKRNQSLDGNKSKIAFSTLNMKKDFQGKRAIKKKTLEKDYHQDNFSAIHAHHKLGVVDESYLLC